MGEEVKKIRQFVSKFWDLAKNHKKGGQIPHEIIEIGIATPQQINTEKKVGINIENYQHVLSTDFIKHVYDNHGNSAVEKSRGNIAINETDFEKIPIILDKPDFVIAGIVYKNENRTLYAKHFGNTTVFVEQLQTRQKTLSAKTFYHSTIELTPDEILVRMAHDKRYNVGKAKIIDGMGGNPHSPDDHNAASAVATSAVPHIISPADNFSTCNHNSGRGEPSFSLSSTSPEKSSDNNPAIIPKTHFSCMSFGIRSLVSFVIQGRFINIGFIKYHEHNAVFG